MSDAPDVTAIVCTYNRRARVLRTCEALAQQDYPGRRYEVIVVDNASTDDTREAIPQFAAQAPVPFRYLYEGQAGKTHALNAAIAVARGRFLAFADDDCAPRPDWLRTLLAPFADDPTLGAVCGPVYSRFPEEVEHDAEQRFLAHKFLGDFTLGETRRELLGRESPLGCNLATPTDLTREIGGYSVRFGPAPGRLGLYEDTEFIQRLTRTGRRVLYEPAAIVDHYPDPARLTRARFRGIAYASGYYGYLSRHHARVPLGRKLLRTGTFTLELLLKGLRVLLLLPLSQRRFVAEFRLRSTAGKLAAVWAKEEG
jgi:glucosyl-dolichyl phosphate glucuronosyltransferase